MCERVLVDMGDSSEVGYTTPPQMPAEGHAMMVGDGPEAEPADHDR